MAVLDKAAEAAPFVLGGAPGLTGLSAYQLALSNGFVGTLADYLASLNGVDGRPGTNGVDGAGTVIALVATVAVPPGSALVPDGTGCRPADPTNTGHRGRVLGITLAGGTAGALVLIQNSGDMAGVTGAFGAGVTLYIALDGSLTATLPPSAAWRQIVAVSTTASRIVINLGEASLIGREDALVADNGGFATRATTSEAANPAISGKWVDPAGVAAATAAATAGKASVGQNADITGMSALKTLASAPAVPDWLNRTNPYGPITVNLGGLPPECLPGGGTVAVFAAIQGLTDVKTPGQNNLSTFAAGLSGIARSRMSNSSPVGVFGAAMANTPDDVTAQVFPFNAVVTNQRDLNPYTTSGVKRAELYGFEIDMEVHPADDGTPPIINARGTWTTGNSRVQPTGEFTAHLVGPAGILRSPQVKWKKAFRSQEGAAEIALEVCQTAVTGSAGSQPIKFIATHPDGSIRTASMQVDATAGLLFRTDSYVAITNNFGGTQHSWSNLGYFPGIDNVMDIGSASSKFRNLYVGNSPIVGSDARLKSVRGEGGFTDAELDAWGDVEPTVYRMKDSVSEKGEAAARLHAGYIAQQIIAVFHARGLDAFAYGLVCEEGLMVEALTPGTGIFKEYRYSAVWVEDEEGQKAPVQRYKPETDPVTGEHLFDEVELPTVIPSTEWTGETQLSVRYDECQVWRDAWGRREMARLRTLVAEFRPATT